jgi:hypothetical protein
MAPLVLIGHGALLAQQTKTQPPSPRKTGTAQILGVVVDSLNGRFLSGAEVFIQGAQATLTTDSRGRFRIDSLAPGTYQVGVFHPLLDTLGITIATPPFYLGADSSSSILLAVPSAATIIRGACRRKPASGERHACCTTALARTAHSSFADFRIPCRQRCRRGAGDR